MLTTHLTVPQNPRFFVVEGLDGSGKSTLAADLSRVLGGQSKTTPNKALRRISSDVMAGLAGSPLAKQTYYLATVAHASDQARRAVGNGQTVVLDRYLLSTMVYATARGGALPWAELEKRLFPAHVTLFVDVPLAVRRRRLEMRSMHAEDRETLDPSMDASLRSLYFEWADHRVAGRFIHLDLNGRESPRQVRELALSHLLPVAA